MFCGVNARSIMACLNVLKQEIKVIESTFPKDHDRFQVHTATVDEVICKFVGPTGRQFEIIGNITVSALTAVTFLRRSTLSFFAFYRRRILALRLSGLRTPMIVK